MTEREFIIPIPEEQANYLQRLGNEIDSKVFIIDRLFSNHATDDDIQLFESVPYKHYMKLYEQDHMAWSLAKTEFEQKYLRPLVEQKTGIENPSFNWRIDDYSSLECKVTLV